MATLAGVAAGLTAAAEMKVLPTDVADRARARAAQARALIEHRGVRGGRLVKWLDATLVDASLLGVAALYDVLPVDDDRIASTVAEIEHDLTSGTDVITGVHRYREDTFYGGGQWPVLACLLATHHLRSGRRARAAQLLEWVVGSADSDLLLPEQRAPRLAPARLSEWEDRWGPSADPLLWSHGAFLSAVEAWEMY